MPWNGVRWSHPKTILIHSEFVHGSEKWWQPLKKSCSWIWKLVTLKFACIGKLFSIFWGIECYPMIDFAGAIASSPIATANWPVGALTRWGGLGLGSGTRTIFNRGKSRTEWAMVSIHVLVYERVKDKYKYSHTPRITWYHPFWEESCPGQPPIWQDLYIPYAPWCWNMHTNIYPINDPVM